MEQRSVLLRGIATFLNAGGSALVDVYDAAASIMPDVLTGEKGKLKAQLREYEKKIERLYSEIGKEVALRTNTAETATEDPAHLSAAAEAGIKRVAEYQAEIEKIGQSIQQIEAEAAAAAKKESAPKRAAAVAKKAPKQTEQSIADTEESLETELSEEGIPVAQEATTEEIKAVSEEVAEKPASEMTASAPESAEPEAAAESTYDKPEESADILVEEAETPEPELQKETAESEALLAGETMPETGTEAAATVELETLLKNDLLQICSEKGIEADKRMTKAEIIELISRR